MKKLLLMACSAIVVTACGSNTGSENPGLDSSSHSTQHSPSNNSPQATGDTTALSGQSMMGIMQANMAQMKGVPTTGNPDNDFAALMKIHHMGAIEMAQLQIARGSDPQIKAMAQKMLDAQQKEVAELNTFLSGHEAHGGGEGFYKEVMSKMGSMSMNMDHSGSIDKQFVEMMIPHHQGAIDMANAYIKAGAHEEALKTMANKIVSDQKREIAELQTWLTKNN